jgi:CO/xanthine dehydrogenase FAD-binding subunit
VDYIRVTSEAELAIALQRDGAALLAGGTDLLVKIRAGVAHPRELIDVSHVESLGRVSQSAEGIVIGAGARVEDLARSPLIRDHYPLLATVLRSLGSPQIRNRATLGGNLANASPAADSAVALLAYDARLTLASADHERALDLEDFFRGPGRTALVHGEYIRSVALPSGRVDWISYFHKVGRRQALTIAISSLAGLLAQKDGTVVEARLAAGSVAPTPLRLRSVEEFLVGRTLDEATARGASEAARRAIAPIDDVRASAAYRREVIGDLVARMVSRAGSQRAVSP